MSWFRDKKKVVDPDKVYDLDDVVWRGVDQMQRLDRLADEADRAAALDKDQPGQGPHFSPKQPASLIDEVIATAAPEDWAAPNPLPVKPEETAAGSKSDEILDLAKAPASAPAPVRHDIKPAQQAPEDVAEDDVVRSVADKISMDMISDAVDAVVASDEVASTVRAEALSETPDPAEYKPKADTAEDQIKDFKRSADMTGGVKSAVEQLVREELSGWLEEHMGRIVAESIPDKVKQSTKSKKPARQTIPKRKRTKKASPVAPKGHLQNRPKSDKPENIIPLKGRDNSS